MTFINNVSRTSYTAATDQRSESSGALTRQHAEHVRDDARLHSLLYNLVNNAIPEVPPHGSVTIGGSHCNGDEFIEFYVKDTGNGMAPETRDNLFTNRVVSRKTGGTGLGT